MTIASYLSLSFATLVSGYLMILGIRAYHSGHRPTGLTAIAAAFGLVIVTGVHLYGHVLTDDAESVALLSRISILERGLSASETDRVALKIEAERALEGRAAVERNHADRMAQVATTVGEIHSRIRDPDTGIQVGTSNAAPPSKTATRDDKILADLASLKSIVAKRGVPQVVIQKAEGSHRVDETRDLIRLKDQMATEVKTPNYDVGVYPDKELVKGRVGRYYVVDLKNAASGIRYYFDGGKYTISRSIPEFRTSLNAFIKDVLGKLDGNVNYELLVRGRADRKPWQGQLDSTHAYSQVTFLRSAGGDKYLSEVGEKRFDPSGLTNDDLPNLRASFLREIVTETYPVKPPMILEGTVSSTDDEKDRNVELLLYVDW
jgi:hypothetical protein